MKRNVYIFITLLATLCLAAVGCRKEQPVATDLEATVEAQHQVTLTAMGSTVETTPEASSVALEPGLTVTMSKTAWSVYAVNDARLANSKINAILVDDNNTKWFATKGGISRFANGQWLVLTKSDPEIQRLIQEAGTNVDEVTFSSMESNGSGGIWVITDFISSNSDSLEETIIPGGITKFSSNDLRFLDQAKCGARVFAGYRDGVEVYTDVFKVWDVKVISPTHRADWRVGNEVWGFGEEHLCHHIPDLGNNNIVLAKGVIITSAAVDANENIWVTLYQLDSQRSTLARIILDDEKFQYNFEQVEIMPDNIAGTGHFMTLAIDVTGDMWIGTDSGVIMFDGKGWFGYDSQNSGLQGTAVREIAIDEYGNKWFATDNGISMFNGSSWSAYTVVDGLVSDNVFALAVDKDNVIWIGSDKGVNRLEQNR